MPRLPIPPETPTTWDLKPVAQPTVGISGAWCTIACRTRLQGPPRTCFAAVVDAPAYGEWNKFCRAFNLVEPDHAGQRWLTCGTKFALDVYMDPAAQSGRPVDAEVSVLERIDEEDEEAVEAGNKGARRAGWRVAWRTRGGMPGWLLRAERTQEFVACKTENGEEATDYVSLETFYGVLAPVVKAMVGAQLVRGVDLWGDCLKERVKKQKEEGESGTEEFPWEKGVGCGRLPAL